MNKEMVAAFIRHTLTVLAGAIIATKPGSLDEIVNTLMNNIATGDVSAIVGTSLVIIAMVWSMWVKMTEESKQAVIKTLTFRK